MHYMLQNQAKSSPILFNQGINHDQFDKQGTLFRLANFFEKIIALQLLELHLEGLCILYK